MRGELLSDRRPVPGERICLIREDDEGLALAVLRARKHDMVACGEGDVM
jgi:hypothetical protein